MTKICPSCGEPLELIGSIGISDWDMRWEAEVERFRCKNKHMIFVADAEHIDTAEEEAANEDDKANAVWWDDRD